MVKFSAKKAAALEESRKRPYYKRKHDVTVYTYTSINLDVGRKSDSHTAHQRKAESSA